MTGPFAYSCVEAGDACPGHPVKWASCGPREREQFSTVLAYRAQKPLIAERNALLIEVEEAQAALKRAMAKVVELRGMLRNSIADRQAARMDLDLTYMERDAMRPVVEAAKAWRLGRSRGCAVRLADAVDAHAAWRPAQPGDTPRAGTRMTDPVLDEAPPRPRGTSQGCDQPEELNPT